MYGTSNVALSSTIHAHGHHERRAARQATLPHGSFWQDKQLPAATARFFAACFYGPEGTRLVHAKIGRVRFFHIM